MRRAIVLLLFLVSPSCATPTQAPFALDMEWLRGCWISADRTAVMRWLPPAGGRVTLVGNYGDITGARGPERWLLEQRPQGLILVRPITTPGGPVETFALAGAGPTEAIFAGAAGVTIRLAGGDDRLTMTLETPSARTTLFDGDRDGCD